jgi:hypothetical protein
MYATKSLSNLKKQILGFFVKKEKGFVLLSLFAQFYYSTEYAYEFPPQGQLCAVQNKETEIGHGIWNTMLLLTTRLAFERIYRLLFWLLWRAALRTYDAQNPLQKRQALCSQLVS